MKQRELEMALQSLEELASPKPDLEQYSTPAKIAADILYIAFGMEDIEGKGVIDLGCGNGIFAIGSCLLGASKVCGVDADTAVLEVAVENSNKLNCDIDFLRKDVNEVEGRFDTCIQNPPFGSQKRHADVPFLHKAMEIAEVVYTIHNSKTVTFIEREARALGGNITATKDYSFEIKHSFDFHRKETVNIDVTMFRIERGK